MPSGSIDKLAFDSNAIRQVLNALVRPVNLQNGLLYSRLVEQRIQHPSYKGFGRHEARVHALLTLIQNLISETYHDICDNLHLQTLTPKSRDEAFSFIRRDAVADSSLLIVWSLLYYCYATPLLDITLDDFSDVVGFHKRTGQRNFVEAVELLYKRFADAEINYRLQIQSTKILAKLPFNETLIGREQMIQRIDALLIDHRKLYLSLVGPSGVGKTALACEVVRKLVRSRLFDLSLWIPSPKRIRDVELAIRAEIGVGEFEEFDLAQYCQLYDVLIVIDDAQLNDTDLAKVAKLLSDSVVIMTSIAIKRIIPTMLTIRVGDLSKESALLCAQDLALRQGLSKQDALSISQTVVEATGGNPAAILFALGLALGQQEDTLPRPFLLLERIYEHETAAFDLLLLIAVLGHQGIQQSELDQIFEIMPDWVTKHDLNLLRRYLLIEHNAVNQVYRARTSLVKRLANTYQIEYPELSSGVGQAIHKILARFDHLTPDVRQKLAVALLSPDWRKYTDWQNLIESHHYLARTSNNIMIWREAIENYIASRGDLNTNVLVTYAFCLRTVGVFNQAENICHVAITQAGDAGNFVAMGCGLCELALIYMRTGMYHKTIELLTRTETIVNQYGDDGLVDQLYSIYVRFYLDQQMYDEAAEALKYVSVQPENLRLQVDICIARSDWQTAIDTLNILETLASEHNSISWVDINTQYGHLAYAQARFEEASDFFRTAAVQHEDRSRYVQQARALTNAASALLHLGHREEAGSLLHQSMKIQRVLGDVVGLQATQANLKHLEKIDPEGSSTLDENDLEQ